MQVGTLALTQNLSRVLNIIIGLAIRYVFHYSSAVAITNWQVNNQNRLQNIFVNKISLFSSYFVILQNTRNLI